MATGWVKVTRTHSGSEATTHVNLGQAFLLTRTIDSTTRIDFGVPPAAVPPIVMGESAPTPSIEVTETPEEILGQL
jgi:hypothetical protein